MSLQESTYTKKPASEHPSVPKSPLQSLLILDQSPQLLHELLAVPTILDIAEDGPTGHSTVAERLLQSVLGATDATLLQGPIAGRDELLEGSGGGEVFDCRGGARGGRES